MQKNFLVIIVFLFLFSFIYAQEKQIKIATFNCEFLTKPKVHIKFGLPFNMSSASEDQKAEWNAPGYRDQKFKEASEAVADVLSQLDASVLALTEVGSREDVDLLVSSLRDKGSDYQFSEVCVSRDIFTKQHVAVLSKFPITEVIQQIPGRESYLQEPDDPDSENDTGISKGIRVKFEAHGKEFIIYVLHFSSERGGHEKDMQRISQASIARRHMLPALKADKNVIVCGDLNDKKGQPTLLRLRGLDDIHEDLIQTGHVKYFDEDKLDTRWTYQYQGVYQQIDHVLLSYNIKEICKRSGIKAETFDHGNHLASDHKPFIVTLKLK